MKKISDQFWSLIEFLLGSLFVWAGIQTFSASPVSGEGPVAKLLGGEAALIFYSVLFLSCGLWLLASKFLRKRVWHKHALMVIYLVCLFVFFLEWAIEGTLTSNLFDQVIFGLLAAWLWLRWKLKTEYIDPSEWDEDRRELSRLDTPAN